MPDIFDMVTAKEIATYYTTAGTNKIPLLGATLFPSKKQLGLDLSWIKGSNGLAVALKPSAFDADAELRDRIGISKIETEMPFFRESMRIGEKDRQELNKVAAAANAALLQPIFAKIYDDSTKLIDGADVQAERMRMQLLSTGKINVSDGRMVYTYDYKFKAAHKTTLAGTAMWSDIANSNPVKDILGWMDLVEENTGVRPTRAICTRKTWGNLLDNEKIRKDMNPIGGTNLIMTDSMLQQYLLNKLSLTVAVYSKKFSLSVGGAAQQYFPDDIFTLIPDGVLGNTYYGTTPEESDLIGGQTNVQVQIVNTGVAVTTKKEYGPPVNTQTTVSAIMLPSFEAIDSCFIARVA